MRVYIINLKRRPDRWEQWKKRAETAGFLTHPFFQIERVDAVDGQRLELTPEIEKMFHVPDPEHFVGKRVPRHHQFNAAVIGCALSHIQLWQRLSVAKAGDDEPAIVMEDDVFLLEHAADRFVSIYEKEAQQDTTWDLLFIGFSFDRDLYHDTWVSRNLKKFSSDLRWYGSGLHAYCIRPKGARALLQQIERLGVQQPIDHFVVDHFPEMCVYKCQPLLARAEHFDICWENMRADSDIQNSNKVLKVIPNCKYYCNNGLDRFIEEHLLRLNLMEKNGFFIDIGGRSVKDVDVTKLFEDHGWNGICIDYIPEFYRLAKQTRKCKCLPDFIHGFQQYGFKIFYRGVTKNDPSVQKMETRARSLQSIIDDAACSHKIDLLVLQSTMSHSLSILQTVCFAQTHISVIVVRVTSKPHFTEQEFEKKIDFFLKDQSYISLITLGEYRIYLRLSFVHDSMRDNEKFREFFINCTATASTKISNP